MPPVVNEVVVADAMVKVEDSSGYFLANIEFVCVCSWTRRPRRPAASNKVQDVIVSDHEKDSQQVPDVHTSVSSIAFQIKDTYNRQC
ncbi:hypothetical protein Tco_1111345, partial [Tanacetum coccineum]